jgi:hypothetical protein
MGLINHKMLVHVNKPIHEPEEEKENEENSINPSFSLEGLGIQNKTEQIEE